MAFKINRSQPEIDPFMSPKSWEFNYVCNFPQQSMTLIVEVFSVEAKTKILRTHYVTNNYKKKLQPTEKKTIKTYTAPHFVEALGGKKIRAPFCPAFSRSDSSTWMTCQFALSAVISKCLAQSLPLYLFSPHQ